jgi:hypothetical protein
MPVEGNGPGDPDIYLERFSKITENIWPKIRTRNLLMNYQECDILWEAVQNDEIINRTK